MKVLPANWKKWLIRYWAGRYPERLGQWSPGRLACSLAVATATNS